MSSVTIITDGSADNRTGSGGWAAIVRSSDSLVELVGCADNTTSNRMELMAAIEGLRAVTTPSDVTVVADSSYLLKTMRHKWYENWIKQAAAGAPPRPNMDLWYALIGLAQFHNITWIKIKGHSGDYWNTRADRLADKARREKLSNRHAVVSWDASLRCTSLSQSERQCKLHSNHSGNCYYANNKADGLAAYGLL